MYKQKLGILGIIGILHTPLASGAELACRGAVTPQLQSEKNMRLWVHEFEAGKNDLAMTGDAAAEDIKRVSFSAANSACTYRPLAIERGGDWGWHLVWAEQGKGVFYARMDGEAWVSSPKKRITSSPVEQLELKLMGQQLEIRWQDEFGQRFNRKSADEGRSWN